MSITKNSVSKGSAFMIVPKYLPTALGLDVSAILLTLIDYEEFGSIKGAKVMYPTIERNLQISYYRARQIIQQLTAMGFIKEKSRTKTHNNPIVQIDQFFVCSFFHTLSCILKIASERVTKSMGAKAAKHFAKKFYKKEGTQYITTPYAAKFKVFCDELIQKAEAGELLNGKAYKFDLDDDDAFFNCLIAADSVDFEKLACKIINQVPYTD